MLEMSPGMNGATYDDIAAALTPVAPLAVLSKYQPDGSIALQKVCLQGNFPTHRFEVCGVNTDQCVYRTVCGLLAINPEATVNIPTAACNCEWDANPWDSFESGLRNAGAGRLLERCQFEHGPSPKNRGKWSS